MSGIIHIDFQAGAHGQYLEFVCNKILGLTVGLPFNSLGSSHDKIYPGKKIFYADHYSFSLGSIPFRSDKIISIQIAPDDLLPLQQISLLRAGDLNHDVEYLEIDTYNKFNTWQYRWVLDKILHSFFDNQIQDSYNAVKDPSWPTVTTLDEFENLPEWIKKECREQHKLTLLELSTDRPDCPKYILREFFKIGFLHPEHNGFMVRQQEVTYDSGKQVYEFPFACFYDMNNFLIEIKKVAEWAKMSYTCQDDIEELHHEFLKRQPYKNSKFKCDKIVKQIQNNKASDLDKLNVIEEAYINAKLGRDYFL